MDNNINNNKNNPNIRSQATTTTTTSSSTDFVLQWGNRKRLRCMKQQQQQQLTKDEKLPLGQRSITARGDRRNKDSLSNGGINLRQRSSSPAHRVLRNCESTTIGMKAGHQSNGDNKRNNHKNNNGGGNGSGGSSETGAKSSGNEMMVWPPKFAIGLTNKEKEEDFLAIKGSKLPQRPKKRAKFIQRTINLVCPGGWLCDLTLERYEVREKKITKKRPRGLKAMGSIESESE